jgi:hypothetical protein
MPSKAALPYALLLCLLFSACGGPEMSYTGGSAAESSLLPTEAPADSPTPATANNPADPLRANTQRIIYTGEIRLVVKDFDSAKAEIDRLLQKAEGFIANFAEDRVYGDQRHGHWVVRVPVPAFQGFLDELASLGVAESQGIDGQDVTAEYIDLEARLKNQRVLEDRMLKLLEDRSGEIKEIIAVEEQLARVRGEIEQMEGRLRYLKDRTELTTVTIDVREDKSYVPPAPPTLAARVTSSWTDSLTGLRQFGESALVILVGAIPWLLVLAVIVLPAVWGVRRKLRGGSKVSG